MAKKKKRNPVRKKPSSNRRKGGKIGRKKRVSVKPKIRRNPKGTSKKGNGKKGRGRRGGRRGLSDKDKDSNKNDRKRDRKRDRRKRGRGAGRKKDSIADRAYAQYLKKMFVPDGSNIYIAEMNNVVRERMATNVRYDGEMPALFANIRLAAWGSGANASDVVVERFLSSPWGARVEVQNNGSKDIYLNKDGQAIFNINGGTLIKDESTTTVSLPSKSARSGESTVEFKGSWTQTKAQADALGQWVLTHQGDGGEMYSLEVFGNIYLDVGDLVVINYPKENISSASVFIVNSVSHTFDNGLQTVLGVRRIYPTAAKAFAHRMGIDQTPLLANL